MRLALIRRSEGKHGTTPRDAQWRERKASAPTPPPRDDYAGAFARVRLVRAWIGAAAAMVALGYAFSTLLDRILLP